MLLCGMLLFLVLFCLLTGTVFLKMKEKNLGFWEKLPRNRPVGGLLGAVALLAFIPNVRPLFPPEGNLIWLIPSALILALMCYLYLDYLFARAAAAILILGAHTVLKMGYPANPPGYPLLAALVLAAGVIGIAISAKPYWLRDWFRLSFRNPAVRWSSAAYFLLLGAMSCFCAVGA